MSSESDNKTVKNNLHRSSSQFPQTKLSAYILALRPWSFSVSLMPVLLGFALASQTGNNCSYFRFMITTLTALSVHGAGNAVNTYYDYVKGIDSKKSDDRTLVDHLLVKKDITYLGVILYGIGCFGFIILAIISPVKLTHLAVVYFGGLSGSFLYTGGPVGFKYIGLGDLLILIIFGPVTVLFSYMIQTGNVNFATIYYAMPLALSAEAILHANNTRDLESDKKAEIVTLAILVGSTGSEILFAIFLLAPFTMFSIWGFKHSPWLLLPLITLPEAFKIENSFRRENKRMIPRRTAKLNLFMGFLYTIGVYMATPNSLPYL